MAEVANNLKRSSSNTKKPELGIENIPDIYLKQNFRLSQSFFSIQSQEEANLKSQELNEKLEIVEQNLASEIALNFDKFNSAFESFDEIRDDLGEIQNQVELSKVCIQGLKE